MVSNVKDFQRIGQLLAKSRKEIYADDTLTESQRKAKFDAILKHYMDSGIEWDSKTGKASIAAGWYADELGRIIKE